MSVLSSPPPRDQDSDSSPPLTGVFERFQRAVSQQCVTDMLRGRSAFSREGPLSAWIVIWLILFQRLHALGTLAVAVQELHTGPVKGCVRWGKRHPRRLSASTSAYSQARSRLPLDVAEKVSDVMFASLWEAKTLAGVPVPVFLLDGSSLQTRHSQELVEAFPPMRNGHGISHWPVIRVLVAHEVISGLAVRPCWGPMCGDQAVSEQGLAKELIARLPPGSGALGDRNFGVFSMAYHTQQHSHPCLFRLTKSRAGKLNGGLCPISGTDKPVFWTPSRDDRRTNPEIPSTACVPGRLLVLRLRGGQRQKIYFFTTFDLPAPKILELYGYRWNIETDLRWLKRQVRLHMIEAESKAMAEKELVLAVAAYNLTRAAMNQAAAALQIDPRQLSYSRVQSTISAFLPLLATTKTELGRKALLADMLHLLAYSKLPRRRKRRSAPREVWLRTQSFPKRRPPKKSTPQAKRKKLA